MSTPDFTLNAGQRPKVNIVTRSDDGTEASHPFEVLPMTKPRYDEYMKYAKKARPLQKALQELEAGGGEPTDKQQADATNAMIDAIELRIRSTNGPVTIRSMWEEGLLAVSDLRLLGEYLNEEAAGNPPA